MPNTFSPALGLLLPAANAPAWNTAVNADLATLDAQAPVAMFAVRPANVVNATGASTSLNVAVAAGVFRQQAGTLFSYAGVSSYALPGAATTCLWLTDAGVLTAGSAFPAGNVLRVATVTTTTVVTAIADDRVAYHSTGAPNTALPATVVAAASATLSAANPLTLVNFGGAVALALPAASSLPAGTSFRVADASGAASTNAITITRAGSDTVNGGTSLAITTNYGGYRLWCDGTSHWFTIP